MGFKSDPNSYGQTLNYHLNKMKPGDFFLVDNSTFANAGIRYLSNIPYGHAILYLGHVGHEKHACLQIPMKHGPKSLSFFLNEDDSNGILFIRCLQLADQTRLRIKLTALAYYENVKARGGWSQDLFTMALQGVNTTVVRVARAGAGFVVADDETVFDHGSSDSQLRRATADQGIAEVVGTSLSGWRMIYNKLRDRKDLPSLTCASLVTWTHYQGGHQLLKGFTFNPEIAQPQQLYTRAMGSKGDFDCKTVTFGHGRGGSARKIR